MLPDQYVVLVALQFSANRTRILKSVATVCFHSHPLLQSLSCTEYLYVSSSSSNGQKGTPDLTFLEDQDGLKLNGTLQLLVYDCADWVEAGQL